MSGMTDSQEPGQADRSNSSGASSLNCDQDGQHSGPSTGGNGKVPPPSDKTISCVSCRKRKLKCDRFKPKCGTCSRLRHDCEYPERKRNLGSKRRNMKELEARLAQVETQLVSESKTAVTSETLPIMNNEPDWGSLGMDIDINLDMGDAETMGASFDISQPGFGLSTEPAIPPEDFFSHELLALGLQEPLPPQDMIDELHTIYFETYHKTMPIMHKYRYYASLDRAPHMRPPVCLRYAIWTMAASLSDKYACFEDVLYERTRRYLQIDEMKGHGEAFVSLYHVQAWGIISHYEAKKTYFSRSWMSTGRTVRLVHMLGLHRLDGEGGQIKRILAPPRDWIEHEERRRGFWLAFYGDRWASSGTGWPMIINEKEIMTNLPAAEESFEDGVSQTTVPLAEALTPEGASKVSPFGGVILSATLFGHNFQHLHHTGVDEHPEDLANGEFWKRHRKMDNVLSNTFMFLPDHLRLPTGLRDVNVIFLHMNIHASAICLHQAAILTAEKHKLDENFMQQCRSRSLTAADEIVNIMRMISHLDTSNMNSWTGFCLYVAGGVLIQDEKLDLRRSQTLNNLEFLISAMNALGAKHSITKHFTAQLELDIEASGIGKSPGRSFLNSKVPSVPLNGLIDGQSMTLEDLCLYAGNSSNETAVNLPDGHTTIEMYQNIGVTPQARGLPASLQCFSDWEDPPGFSAFVSHPSKNWNTKGKTPYTDQATTQNFAAASAVAFPASNQTVNEIDESCPYENFVQPSGLATGNTPSSDSSTPHTMQFPYRQAESRSRENSTYDLGFDATGFINPPEQTPKDGYDANLKHLTTQTHDFNAFLEDQMWGKEGFSG